MDIIEDENSISTTVLVGDKERIILYPNDTFAYYDSISPFSYYKGTWSLNGIVMTFDVKSHTGHDIKPYTINVAVDIFLIDDDNYTADWKFSRTIMCEIETHFYQLKRSNFSM
jgi:hypothetical protein